MLDPERVNGYFERGMIEVAPLAFMRGRTLNDSFVILDEAQNTTPEQMKMFLTRLGFGSQDGGHRRHHPDRPADATSAPGLIEVGDILDEVEDIAFIRFGGEDVVRHKLVQRIVAAYGEHASAGELDDGRRGAADIDLSDVPSCARRSAAALARRPGSTTATSAVEIVGEGRMRDAQLRRTAAWTSRPTCSPSRSTSRPDAPGPRELGDVVICPEHGADVTEAAVHGTLHLCGFDHETDGGEMLALQARDPGGRWA